MAVAMNKICPVCGLEQSQDSHCCARCGWEFAVLLGSLEQVGAYLTKRLEEAKTAWQQRRYNPEFVPELQRDPFETVDEFSARLVERCWYVGDVELEKSGYDIETGHFPLRLIKAHEWVRPWLADLDAMYLCISRDSARQLYQRSAIWPIYAQLVVKNTQVLLDKLLFITNEDAFLVKRVSFVSKSEIEAKSVGAILNDRYIDHGDGTVSDSKTGLRWMRCALGQTWMDNTCHGHAKKFTWKDAVDYIKRLNQEGGYAGYADWRMPSIAELKTLIYCSGGQPQIWNKTGLPCKGSFERPTLDQAAFPNTDSGCFWSASICDNYSNYAWYVQFKNGSIYYENIDHALHVRFLRI